jgi:hypothetical protein
LGGDVMHGGALCVQYAKDIMLGRSQESFRKFADEVEECQNRTPLKFSIDEKSKTLEDLSSLPNFELEEIAAIQTAIAYAPSAGNLRPWAWQNNNGKIYGSVEVYGHHSAGDHCQIASYMSLGASLENIKQTLDHFGYPFEISQNQTTALHTNIEIMVGKKEASKISLYNQIHHRKTNRGFLNDDKIDAKIVDSIIKDLNSDFEILFHTNTEILKGVGQLLGEAEKIRFTSPLGHQEFFEHEVNWTTKQAEERGIGLNIEHFNMSPKKMVGLKLSSNPLVMEHLNTIAGGEGFTLMSEDYFINPAPVLFINCKAFNHEEFIQCGSLLQNIWLKLTQYGIDLHPMPAIPFMCAHLHQESPLNIVDLKKLESIHSKYLNLIMAQQSVSLMMARVVVNKHYSHRVHRF